MSSKKVIEGSGHHHHRRRGLIAGVVFLGLIGFAIRENTQLVKMATTTITTSTTSLKKYHPPPPQDDDQDDDAADIINNNNNNNKLLLESNSKLVESNSKVVESNSKLLESNTMTLSLLQQSSSSSNTTTTNDSTTTAKGNGGDVVVLKKKTVDSSPSLPASPIKNQQQGGEGRSSPQHQSRPPPFRFLFGIFSVDKPKDHEQRQAIRETYLNHYHRRNHYYYRRKWRNKTNTSNNDHHDDDDDDMICSLYELQSNILLQRNPFSCQFVYTFVLGGGGGTPNTTAPGEIFWKKGGGQHGTNSNSTTSSKSTSTTRMTSNQILVPEEDIDTLLTYNAAFEYKTHNKDLLLLNVYENQHNGKVPTWYTYVAALMEEYPTLSIHFVGKLDSDTLVKPMEFSNWIQTNSNRLQQPYVFSGWMIPCQNNKYCNFTNMKAPLFMPGGFSFVSISIVKYVSLELSEEEKKRYTLLGPYEDISWSNLVYSIEENRIGTITPISLGPTGRGCGIHGLKDPIIFRNTYETLFETEMEAEKEEEEESRSF